VRWSLGGDVYVVGKKKGNSLSADEKGARQVPLDRKEDLPQLMEEGGEKKRNGVTTCARERKKEKEKKRDAFKTSASGHLKKEKEHFFPYPEEGKEGGE